MEEVKKNYSPIGFTAKEMELVSDILSKLGAEDRRKLFYVFQEWAGANKWTGADFEDVVKLKALYFLFGTLSEKETEGENLISYYRGK